MIGSRARWCLAAAVLALGFAGAACDRQPSRTVSLQEREQIAPPKTDQQGEALRVAVGAMLIPEEGFAHYRLLLERLGEQVGRPVKIVDRRSYAAVNEALRKGEIDAAFVCSGPYVQGRREFGLELLVVPEAYGRTSYHAYVIVPAGSPARRIEDLRGKSFAFTDPDSNTGKLVPTSLLASMGTTPERFFSRTIMTGSHDKSILAVAEQLVAGASVDSLIFDYAAHVKPEVTARTRIIWKSPPYGIPPFVVRPGLDPALKARIHDALLALDDDPAGREILRKLMIDRFVDGRDEDYDSIRALTPAAAAPPPAPRP
jgi:phosphonate transport system substrate-binding protein